MNLFCFNYQFLKNSVVICFFSNNLWMWSEKLKNGAKNIFYSSAHIALWAEKNNEWLPNFSRFLFHNLSWILIMKAADFIHSDIATILCLSNQSHTLSWYIESVIALRFSIWLLYIDYIINGLLNRWTDIFIMPWPAWGEAFNPNNATQTHSIFVKL